MKPLRSQRTRRPAMHPSLWVIVIALYVLATCSALEFASETEDPAGVWLTSALAILCLWVSFILWVVKQNDEPDSRKPAVARGFCLVACGVAGVAIWVTAEGRLADRVGDFWFLVAIIGTVFFDWLPPIPPSGGSERPADQPTMSRR